MIKLKNIYKSLRDLQEYGLGPGLIILNAQDFDELIASLNLSIIKKPRTLLGIELLVIPYYLENPRFLKLGQALVLEEKWVNFLKENLNDKKNFKIKKSKTNKTK